MSSNSEEVVMNQGHAFRCIWKNFHFTQKQILDVLVDIAGSCDGLDEPYMSRLVNQREKGRAVFQDKADEIFDAFIADELCGKSPEDLADNLYLLKKWAKDNNLTFNGINSRDCEKWLKNMLRCSLKNFDTCENPKKRQPSRKTSIQLKGQNFTAASPVLGRQEIFAEIRTALKAGYAAVLRGMAGIGKSVLARQFAALHREEYPHIQEVSADTEHPEDIMRRVILKVNFDGMKTGRKSEEEIFSAKLEALRNLKGDSLLIIDGLDTFPKDLHILLDIIRESKLRIIITTRLTAFFSKMKTLNVPALELGEQRELFETHYGRGIGTPENMKTLRKILAYGDGNTMYIEQLARYIKKHEYTLGEALEYLHEGYSFPDKWFVRKDNASYEDDTLLGVFGKILFPREVSPVRVKVLKKLAMLPPEGESRRKVFDVFDDDMRRELQLLEDEGYAVLEQTPERNITKVHPLIRSVVRAMFC